jgi:hypothetical protein
LQLSRFRQSISAFSRRPLVSTIRQIKDSPIDIKTTARLNKLFIELLKDNPEWAAEARWHD